MNIGMLWFDNDKQADLVTKIQRAASYYHTKYGKAPNLCLVNPKTLGDASIKKNGIEIKAARSVLPNHFWLGVTNNAAPASS